MYKVRADAVSGKKVYAGGKYLTCIGNARVNVGDSVWTDGRCVYGFYKEGNTPIVIVPPEPVEEIIGIPILVRAASNNRYIKVAYSTYDSEGNFEILSSFQTDKTSDLAFNDMMMWNDSEKAYIWGVQAGDSGSSTPLAMNYGDTGNECRIDYEYTPAADEEDEKGFVRVRENSSVIFSTEDLYSVLGRAELDVVDASLPNFNEQRAIFQRGGGCFCGLNHAFIEDKNNWAFIVSVTVTFQTEDDDRGEDYLDTYWETAASESIYLYTSGGVKRRIAYLYGKKGITERVRRTDTPVSKREEFDTSGARIPMQDGYYYTFNFYPTPPLFLESVKFEYRTIYSPEGKEIYGGYFSAFSYLTIYEMPDGSHLLGVRTPYRSYYVIESNSDSDIYAGYTEPSGVTKSGIYLIRDKEIIAVYASQSNLSCLNQRFRPMADYKNWTSKMSAKG